MKHMFMLGFFMIKNNSFLKNTFKIMIPIAMQNLIFSSLNMVDTLMIGQLGEQTIAGVSLANQFFFVLTLIYFGITGGATIFSSQFWGAQNINKIKNIFAVSIKIVFFTGLIFTISGLFFPTKVLTFFTNDPGVIILGSQYLRIVSACYIFSGLSFLTTGILRSMGEVKLPLKISAISLILNTFINYLLIFGSFGFPKLGVPGAAIATLISRTVEFLLIIIVLTLKKSPLIQLKKKDFKLSGDLQEKFYRTLLPVIVNEGLWASGTAIFSAIYARISTESLAAYQIQQTVITVFLIFVFGIGNTSCILVGNKLGEGKPEEAYRFGKGFIKLSTLIGLITGLIIFMFAPFLTGLFKVSPDVIFKSKNLISIFALILVFKAFNITIVVGILRGGGDTKVAMFMDIVGIWLIGIPLGLLSAFVFKLPIEIVYIFISIEELIKVPYGLYRFKSKKWINNLSN